MVYGARGPLVPRRERMNRQCLRATTSAVPSGPGSASLRRPEDDEQLDAFLKRLAHHDTHLRPGIELRRIWPWAHAVDLDERGALAGEIRAALTELLTSIPGGRCGARPGP